MDIVSHNQKPWVLVVDDHELSRQFTVQALRQITSRVKQAGTGRAALNMAARFRPELIFLDLNLPDTDGFTLLNEILSVWPPESPQPEIVMLSGDSSLSAGPVSKRPEKISILAKPARRRDIRKLAARCLSSAGGVRESSEPRGAGAPQPSLDVIFQRDLNRQGPLLDEHISSLDWRSAQGILHQMIAASAMCHETEIERYCRLLNDELARIPQPKQLSQAYFGLLRAIEQARNEHHT